MSNKTILADDDTLQMLIRMIMENGKDDNSKMVLILQGITVAITALQPIFMYWIQAKYNAPPPHGMTRGIDDTEDDYSIERDDNNNDHVIQEV